MRLAFYFVCLAILCVSVIAKRGGNITRNGYRKRLIAGKFKPFCPYGKNGPFCTEENYYNFLPPKTNESGGTLVNVSFDVLGLSSIDSFAKEFTLLIHVTLAWEDHRIIWKEGTAFQESEDQELILNIETLE